jgi:hypothetical protein
MSISSGWLIAKATVRAKESSEMAYSSQKCPMAAATSASVTLFGNSVATAPGAPRAPSTSC